jgi:branched-chain amino acid transport system permease protein
MRSSHLLVVPLLALGGCIGVDGDQARLCRTALPALEQPLTRIVVQRIRTIERGVRVEYRAVPAGGDAVLRFAECRFALGRRTEVEAITTDRGEVPGATAYLLRRYYVETPEGAAADPGPPASDTDVPAWPTPLAVLAQHLLAGAPGAAVLALLAAAYGLVWGLVGRIHLAFGALAAIGATAAGVAVAGVSAGTPSLGGLAAALLLGVTAAALYGLASGYTAFVAVPARQGQGSLIASVGLAMALAEWLRLTAGSHAVWIGTVGAGPVPLARAGDFVVTFVPESALVAGIGLGAALSLALAMRLSRFGRLWRAAAQDPGAAALCGIDVGRLLTVTLLLSGGLAGLAGALAAIRWGALGFADGLALGLKALAGAILGGVGSVPGALAGGLVVGLSESLWSVLFPVDGRDLALFIALVIAIMLRPNGLFARP